MRGGTLATSPLTVQPEKTHRFTHNFEAETTPGPVPQNSPIACDLALPPTLTFLPTINTLAAILSIPSHHHPN